MVRISRGRLSTQRQQQQHKQSIRKTFIKCCLAVVMSAAMPLLFILRMSVSMNRVVHQHQQHSLDTSITALSPQQQPQDLTLSDGAGNLQPQGLQNLPWPFTFLKEVLLHPSAADDKNTPRYLGSDIVELDHCQVQQITDWSSFMAWSGPIVNKTLQALSTSSPQSRNILNHQDYVLMEQEFILELLEMYATRNGFCQFDQYHPSVPFPTPLHKQAAAVLQQQQQQQQQAHASSSLPRFLVVIIAFHDIEQLKRLITAMMLPQHSFIIHLERHTAPEYVEQVQALCQKFTNVVMIQFGTVSYKTDSVSLINLRIMRWVVHDLKLSYDYHVQIDGAAFPLWHAQELALHVQQSPTSVWLGELTHRGQVVRDVDQSDYLQRKRLVHTVGSTTSVANLKLKKKLSKQLISPPNFQQQLSSSSSSTSSSASNKTAWLDVSEVPSFVQNAMKYKTNSGNQAIYSYDTVTKLLQSSQVMELFALAKYGCCCCIEERTWIAALSLIGVPVEDALDHTSMFQVWGGTTEQTCGSSMNNAVLSSNASFCYRLEDVHLHPFKMAGVSTNTNTTTDNQNETGRKKNKSPPSVSIWGNETMSYLKRAKERGVWFARKFKSTDEESMILLRDIQSQLHQPPPPPSS